MKLSEREWTVLQALWKADGAELGTIVQLLQPETGWSRNTVLTYLTRMEAKGLVAIDKEASPHLYRAVPDEESCRKENGPRSIKCKNPFDDICRYRLNQRNRRVHMGEAEITA